MEVNIKSKKRFIIDICVIIIGLILISFVVSYAFFITPGKNNRNEDITLKSGTIELVFSDGDNGINEALNFGDTIIKKFTLENTGTLAASVSLDWLNLINTYINGSLSYKLLYSESLDGEYSEIVPLTDIPVSNTSLTQPLSNEISVPEQTTYYYQLEITLNYLENIDQTKDLESSFQTQFTVGEVSKYRYYDLIVDPNGGTWNEFINKQEYQLRKDDSIDLPDPTREGYTFNGWETKGLSFKINNNTFTMGISNTELKAKWNVNKYKVKIDTGSGDLEEREIEFNGTLDLPSEIVKEGYTFGGWETTGGVLEGNTLRVTEPNDITVRAKWIVNKYKYIVYHNKMNVDGNGYTLVDADVDEGEADYNSIVTPGVKSYIGFRSPSLKDLTIKVEDRYPPILNKVEYNYDRNKYTLTLNLNGGTSSDDTSYEMYYESEKILAIPTKIGYNFTNWTVTSGIMTDNTFKISNENSVATANYSPKTFTITFNANGGTVNTESKTVSYDSTYGDLPVPTYRGYRFIGWYTEQNGGVNVVASTSVKLEDNQILYAKWKKESGINTTLEVLNKTIKSGSPTLKNPSTTDETYNGLYALADDYGTSYYYRGAVQDNYVQFAGFYWRIIRVNGDGTLRIIFDGTKAHNNGESNTDRLALTNQKFNVICDDAKYEGYMYSPNGTASSTSKSQAQTNTVSSNVKTVLENWYKQNIYDKGYDSYISDSIFCNDRSTITSAETPNWSANTGLGYGNNSTAYGAYKRFINNKSNPTPKLKCENKNDAFTKNDTSRGNGALSQKVGMITVDEIVLAGSGQVSTSNNKYYLYKGNWYWSLSPSNFSGSYGGMFGVLESGSMNADYVNEEGGIAPVINLTADFASDMIGNGSISNPFRAS